MACKCGHEAGSPATQRIHENNCTVEVGVVAKVVTAVKKVVKKAK